MRELTIEATPENVDKAIEFVDEMLEEYGYSLFLLIYEPTKIYSIFGGDTEGELADEDAEAVAGDKWWFW